MSEPQDHLARLLIGVGSMHFVVPGMMEKTLPSFAPRKRDIIYVSGVVEVACGIGLATRQPWAPKLAAATLAAIWPANIKMALDAGTGTNPGLADNKALMWARVPMQLPMIWTALRAKTKTT